MTVQSCYCIIKAGEMKRHVTKCYDTTKNLRRFGRVATVYVEMEMSHVYLPKVGKWLVQYFSRSEFFFFFSQYCTVFIDTSSLHHLFSR